MNEPQVIKKLDTVVINRIAAGEVIQRPANALKEMLENSLDAKAKNISVTLKSGGLKLLQIQDDGIGIRKEDLGIVCERFTTSKLQTFEDLSNISTYGFRGEALASISHVAYLTIQTKTKNDKCAYKANYVDSKLVDTPKQCAGTQGTLISVENLFHNIPTRKNAMKSPTEEYQKIHDVVSKYAIHNCTVGFSLKKYGERNDLRTPENSNHIDNIRIIYGNDIARELLEFSTSDKNLNYNCEGYVTNVNYSMKKDVFILFINHRLVDSTSLRKAIDLVFSTYLPKNGHPFMYLSIEIDPKQCDVNIHPTKHEVHFMYEEEIIDNIKQSIEQKLIGSNTSRVFYTQARLPGASDGTSEKKADLNISIHDKNLVRTDSKEQKLEKFFGETTKKRENVKTITVNRKKKPHAVEVKLVSVLQLQKSLKTDTNNNLVLRDIFAQHKFVGVINSKLSVMQHDTKLYLCNTELICKELFYQCLIFDFWNFDRYELKQPHSIYDLAMLGFEFPELNYNEQRDGSKTELAESVKSILIEKSEMLNTYFSLQIDENGFLKAIPVLLENYVPDLTYLPLYIVHLAINVNWESEKECFDSFSRQTALFYSKLPSEKSLTNSENTTDWKWTIEHVIYPAIKQYLLPSTDLTKKGAVLQISVLSELYKVFERC